MKGMRFMKIYEILDYEEKRFIGVLLYYEQKKEFIIELSEHLDEWTAPLLFANLVKQHIFTVPRDLSFLWVKERIIPSGRQNITSILKNHKLESYDEMKFLELSRGRCSQDSLYIKKADKLPEYVRTRNEKNIVDCILCDKRVLLCFFVDGTVRKIDLNTISDMDDVDKILKNDSLYQSCEIGIGGYFITFNDSIDIAADVLYETGVRIPLSRNDFICFAQNNVLDTSQCCEILSCSRQNISYLVKQEKLHAIKENVKGNLYLKADVSRNKW